MIVVETLNITDKHYLLFNKMGPDWSLRMKQPILDSK